MNNPEPLPPGVDSSSQPNNVKAETSGKTPLKINPLAVASSSKSQKIKLTTPLRRRLGLLLKQGMQYDAAIKLLLDQRKKREKRLATFRKLQSRRNMLMEQQIYQKKTSFKPKKRSRGNKNQVRFDLDPVQQSFFNQVPSGPPMSIRPMHTNANRFRTPFPNQLSFFNRPYFMPSPIGFHPNPGATPASSMSNHFPTAFCTPPNMKNMNQFRVPQSSQPGPTFESQRLIPEQNKLAYEKMKILELLQSTENRGQNDVMTRTPSTSNINHATSQCPDRNMPKKEPLDQSTLPKTEPVEQKPNSAGGTLVALCHADYPSTKLTNAQLSLLQQAILRALHELPDEGPEVRFRSCKHEEGWLSLDCVDDASAHWVSEIAKALQPWHGARLKFLYGQDLPKPHVVKVYIPDDSSYNRLTSDEVFVRLRKMNRQLHTEKWRVVNREISGSGQNWIFAIDNLSFETLTGMNFKAYFAFGQVEFHVADQAGTQSQSSHIKTSPSTSRDVPTSSSSFNGQRDNTTRSPFKERQVKCPKPPKPPKIGGDFQHVFPPEPSGVEHNSANFDFNRDRQNNNVRNLLTRFGKH